MAGQDPEQTYEEVGGLHARGPGELGGLAVAPVPGEVLGSADFDADVNTRGGVVAVEGQLDAQLGAQLPAELGADVGLDASTSVRLEGALQGDEDGEVGQEAHGQAHLSGELDVVLGQHAVLGQVELVGLVLELVNLVHQVGDVLVELLQVVEAADGTHQLDVKEADAFVGRARGDLELIPDVLHVVCAVLAGTAVVQGPRVVLGGVGLAEDGLPDVAHVVVPEQNGQRLRDDGTQLVDVLVPEEGGPAVLAGDAVLLGEDRGGQILQAGGLDVEGGVGPASGNALGQGPGMTGLLSAALKGTGIEMKRSCRIG